MTREEFTTFRGVLHRDATTVMNDGADEYATQKDMLFNFKQVASLINTPGVTSYTVACVYFLKHVFSIAREVSIREDMRGRFIDARNYIDLLAALWEEARGADGGGEKSEAMGV